MRSHLDPARLGALAAVLCITTTACMACGTHTVSSSGPTSTAGASKTAGAGGAPATGGDASDSTQPWTVDVSGAAKSDRSDAILAALTAAGGWGNDNVLQTDFSISIFNADSNSPRMDVVGIEDYCGGGPDCDSVPTQMPVPTDATIEGSQELTCDISGNTEGEGDCHLLVTDRDEQKLYELYQASQAGDNMTTQAMFIWDLSKTYPENLRGDQCTSADAAGFPISAMTPTADEVASGTVNHALRFILPNDRMKADVYVHPATHAGGPESADPDAPPYGVRFRLKPDFDESGYSDSEKVILKALKTHGMLLADGGEIALTFADDRNSTAKWADLGIEAQSFNDIGVDQFEVVELGDEIPLTYDCVRNP
jgi:serine/threonine-protein kinase